MVRLEITSDEKDVTELIKSAIQTEIKKQEMGLAKSNREVSRLEDKYKISSEVFLKKYASEDLEGGEEEYVKWVGEIKIKARIADNLNKLREIEYVTQ